MNNRERLLEADAQRRQAMIKADADALARLLAEDLIWTHSSGKTESKSEFIEALAAGAVAYERLEVSQDRVLHSGAHFIHQGVLSGRAIRDDKEKLLDARFLSVWQEAGGQLQMVAWQSTQLS